MINYGEETIYLTFKGEGENWKAEYQVSGYKSFFERELTITYKGELSEISSVKKLEFSYDNSISSGNSEINFIMSPDKKEFSHRSSSSGPVESYNETTKVTIKWNGITETIFLK
ncbi:hypothetical protein L1765_00490 [Microaerobacter geothermalis]|nr:hypothetical protein [Microaerobacter geothermalis]